MRYDTKPLWEADLKRQPEAKVMPCKCGRMPAPITNISGHEQRRCWPCFESEFQTSMDHWDN